MKVFFSILAFFEILLVIYLATTFEGKSAADSWTYLFHRFLWGNFLGMPPLILILFFFFSVKKGGKKSKNGSS